MQLKSILTSSYTHIAVIGILLLLSYGRVLGSYFLADDFGEILYISKIFNGDLGLLLSNFTGNYMQIPSMAVYRPWLLMSLAIDFAFWNTNAFGYYSTNLFHYFACAVLLYLIVKKLTGYWGELRSNLTALSSGLLFALNPLHCESVSWVVGRVDIVCLSFYLLGLLFVAHFNSSKKKSFLIASTVAFWFAIFTKEMAIGLPVMACALVFLCSDSSRRKDFEESTEKNINDDLPPESSSSTRPGKDTPIATIQETSLQTKPAESSVLVKSNLVSKLTTSLNATKPVFIAFTICTITYFIIRYLALGTFTGGYTGSIGASQFSNILTKWLDSDSLFRILFPFNHTLMLDGGIYRLFFSVAYFLVASLAVSRLIFGKWPKRLTALLLIWLFTALAPIYQLYGLGYNLEGMRFCSLPQHHFQW